MRQLIPLLAVLLATLLIGCAGEQGFEEDDLGRDAPREDVIGDGEVEDEEPLGTDAPGEDVIGDDEIADPEDGPY